MVCGVYDAIPINHTLFVGFRPEQSIHRLSSIVQSLKPITDDLTFSPNKLAPTATLLTSTAVPYIDHDQHHPDSGRPVFAYPFLLKIPIGIFQWIIDPASKLPRIQCFNTTGFDRCDILCPGDQEGCCGAHLSEDQQRLR
jgi:hypothetical protein